MEKTRLSNKGQVVIPKAISVLHGWEAGLESVIENVDDGIKLMCDWGTITSF
jgi:bifunctional DNA-binding transcriptional regulator/antitoxin component of YhaV-PrlF toxin-antitoxin module